MQTIKVTIKAPSGCGKDGIKIAILNQVKVTFNVISLKEGFYSIDGDSPTETMVIEVERK